MLDDRSPRVYIPNDAGHDFTLASAFGDLVLISSGFIVKENLESFAGLCERVMRESTQDDYILICSSNILLSICTAIQATKFGCVRFLQWRGDRYVDKVVNFNFLISRGKKSA